MSGRTFVFAGGGTGGHLFPGIAVAHALRALRSDARVVFLTTKRPLDRQLLQPAALEQIEQPVRPFSVNPLGWPGFIADWRASRAAAREILLRERPSAVLGLGGYAAGPAVVAAKKLGIRTAILNPDAVPGRANRYLARYADLIVLQWDESREHFRAAARKCRTLGCPIRAEFATADRPRSAGGTVAAGPSIAAESRRRFGLVPDRAVLLVTGASQGARTVNQAMVRVWPRFFARHSAWQLLHLTGAADEPDVRAAYDAARVTATVLPFTLDMAHAIAAADLVVSRAGASTLSELTALGKPSILMPYPYHRDQHQRHNAEVLVAAGAAVRLDDRRESARNEGPLLAALEQCVAPDVLPRMSVAARTFARPRAAEAVADWLLNAG